MIFSYTDRKFSVTLHVIMFVMLREMCHFSAYLLKSVRSFTRKPCKVARLSSRMPEPIDAAIDVRLLSPYS